jgi:hypothetical protein
MPWLFQPLLMLLARSGDSQLAKQVELLHADGRAEAGVACRRRLRNQMGGTASRTAANQCARHYSSSR